MKEKDPIKVLLIEDDQDDYVLVREYLKEIAGQVYVLDWVNTYQKGLSLIKKGIHEVYLIDYNLGADNGLELIKRACTIHCDKPLILLTGRNDPTIDAIALQSGAADFLMKGHFDAQLLERSIRYSLQRKKSEAEREELFEAQIAKREAEKAQEKISNILESITNAFIALDHNWNFTYANRQIVKRLGKKREDLIGKNVWKLFPEAKKTSFYKKYHEAVKKQKPVEFEEFSPRMKRWFLVQAYPTKDGLSAYYTDISDRKRAQSDLSRFRFMADHANTSLALLDRDGNFLYFNNNTYERLGYSKKEFSSMNAFDINTRYTKTSYQKLFDEAQKKVIAPFETTLVKKDGTMLPVETSVSGVTFEGKPYLFGVSLDIAKRKKTQLALNARIQQQAAVTQLGLLALSGVSLQELMNKTLELVTSILDVEYAKLLELLPPENELLLRSGVGWKKEYPVGRLKESAGKNSPAGYTLLVKKPVIVKDVYQEKRFNIPPLLLDHHVRSGMSAIIYRKDTPYGVLGIYTKKKRVFTREDAAFLQAVSNVISMAIDHTEAQLELRESEERFRMLADTAPVLIWMSDTTKKSFYFNRVWYEFTGRTEDDELGDGWVHGVYKDDITRCIETYHHAFNDRKPFKMEFRLKHNSGEYRWVLDQGTPRFDNNGKFLGYIGSCVDITERKNAEVAIKKSEQRFLKLFNSNIIGVIIATTSGRILEANDEYLKMIGYSRSQFEKDGIQWSKITPPEYKELDLEGVQQLKEKGEMQPFEKEYIRRDGKRIPIMLGGATLDDAKKTAVLFVLDITERKEVEKRKDEFIGLASHELKTPITTIKAFTQLLKKEVPKKNHMAEYLTKMEDHIDKLTNLIRDLLDISRIQSGKIMFDMKPFKVNELMQEIAHDMQHTTSKHKIVCNVDDMQFTGDKDRLGQVFINLISNAIKYSPNADKIIIEGKRIDGKIVISVQDFGIGIPSEKQDMVFERFYRVIEQDRQPFPGLGLGLYISKEIVSRHGGKIWAESEEGKGSKFYMVFPSEKRQKTIEGEVLN